MRKETLAGVVAVVGVALIWNHMSDDPIVGDGSMPYPGASSPAEQGPGLDDSDQPGSNPPAGGNDPNTISIADVIAAGRPLNSGPACRAAFKSERKGGGISWGNSDVFCLGLNGRKPQGVGGTGTGGAHVMDGQRAVDRNIVLVSSYSGSNTHLEVIDTDKKISTDVVLLKRKNGTGRIGKLASHGSGVAMAGDYIYSSSHGELFAYKANGFIKYGKGFGLPAVARASVSGQGGFSSLHVDVTRTPNQLVGINYTTGGGTYVQRFDLAKNGMLAARGGNGSLAINSSYGFPAKQIRSTSTMRMPGTRYQGVASVTIAGQQFTLGTQSGHDLTVMRGKTKMGSVGLAENGVSESLYYDPAQRKLWHVNEHGRQFLYSFSLGQIIARTR